MHPHQLPTHVSVSFERFLALRYLKGAQGRPEGRHFLRFVTYVSIGGVTLGVAALLLALSIVRGFSREIENKLVGFGAHVQVESFTDGPIEGAEALRTDLLTMPGVMAAAPVVQEFVLLRRSARDIDGVSLWGTDEIPAYVAQSMQNGMGSWAGYERSEAPDSARAGPPVVIGRSLARRLGVERGDRVTVFSVRKSNGAITGSVRARQLTVEGIYETDLADFDEIYAFVPMATARELLGYSSDEVTRIDLTLDDPSHADETAVAVEDAHGFPIMARSIYEVYRGLFAWVRLQQRIIPLVISVIVIVAAFNIIGTLLMLILEKTGEIGVLTALGATGRVLRRTFLLLGLMIGGVGVLIGESLAWILGSIQQGYGVIRLPAEAYFMQTAPVEMAVQDFVLVAVVTLLLCGLSAYLPARFAASIQPIRAIHSG